MGGVHQKVFRVLCQHHLEEDKHLSAKICQQVCDVTPQDLKVSPDFICPLPNAVSIFEVGLAVNMYESAYTKLLHKNTHLNF